MLIIPIYRRQNYLVFKTAINLTQRVLVYQVIDNQLVIAVMAVGKRERSDVYYLASERMGAWGMISICVHSDGNRVRQNLLLNFKFILA